MTVDFYPENSGTMFLRNVGKYLAGYTATIPEHWGKCLKTNECEQQDGRTKMGSCPEQDTTP
jgi:hypothetical protein